MTPRWCHRSPTDDGDDSKVVRTHSDVAPAAETSCAEDPFCHSSLVWLKSAVDDRCARRAYRRAHLGSGQRVTLLAVQHRVDASDFFIWLNSEADRPVDDLRHDVRHAE